jgi:hypothetical protein
MTGGEGFEWAYLALRGRGCFYDRMEPGTSEHSWIEQAVSLVGDGAGVSRSARGLFHLIMGNATIQLVASVLLPEQGPD